MVSSLSQIDVARLLAEPSPHIRAEVAGKLAAEIDSPRLTESELKLAQDIIGVMARDAEATVRKALSQSLRGALRLPHDVALRLANDIEAVAMPVLACSPVLTDQDLVEIVSRGSAAKQEAIAGRPHVSETVSDVLIAEAGEKAVSVLMNNATAHISDLSLTRAVDRFAQSDMVKASMARRHVLPVTVTERLVTMVSEQLRDYLVQHHELPSAIAADLVLQSRERSIISLSGGSNEQDIEKLVIQMHANRRLTPTIVLRALCMGDLAFFEAALAVLANVPITNARILIHDAGRLGLKSLYTKSGLPPRLLPAVRIAIEVVRETLMDGGMHDRARYRARVIERILTQYEDFGAEDLDYLLEKLGDVLTNAA
ncbi:MAG: DUF2336 domain-containing protein [Bdellovibrionales bacterium]